MSAPIAITSRFRAVGVLALASSLLVVLALGAFLLLYERFRVELGTRDLPAMQRLAAINEELNATQLALVDLIIRAGDGKLDERAIFNEGKLAFDRVDVLIERSQEATLMPAYVGTEQRRLLGERLRSYRATLATIVEMLSVDPGLAQRYALRAAGKISEVDATVQQVQRAIQAHLEGESRRLAESLLRTALPLAIVLAVVMGALFAYVNRVSRSFARVLSATQSALAELGRGDVKAPIDFVHETREEATIREALERFRLTLLELHAIRAVLDEHSIVSIADLDGRIVYANDKFVEISGFSREELIGSNHRLVGSGLHSDEFFADLWATITAGRVWHGEVCNRRKDGSLYWVAATIAPSLDQNGKPYQYVAVRTDMSEHKRIEASLVEAREVAERASRAKSEFLSRMSHELRTPMNAVLGFAELLAQDPAVGHAQRERVVHILDAGEHLLELINEVLDLARIEAGTLHVELASVDLDEVVDSALRIATPMARKQGLSVVRRGERGLRVRADPGRLRQVLINLLSNGCKYNRPGGALRLAVEGSTDGAAARISVTDEGGGIPAERIPELFQPFNRLGAERSGVDGTGIGLAISDRLAKMMYGHIAVVSPPDEGATFTLTLPRA